jgi:hypothetical protein
MCEDKVTMQMGIHSPHLEILEGDILEVDKNQWWSNVALCEPGLALVHLLQLGGVEIVHF